MRKFAKIMTGAATAAIMTVTAAAPAEAQRYRNRDRGIDAGDIITGVAVVGGIAAIASAIGNTSRGYQNGYGYDRGYQSGYGYPGGYQGGYGYDRGYQSGYGYDNRSGYGQSAAINACSYQAQRYGQGQVQIVDIDRSGNRSFRVRGVIDNNNNSGYYNRGGYDRYDRYSQRVGFTCTARDNGRVIDFDTHRG